ncbi:citrate lyase holo-[acyl-carrier protein] synthase [Kluyvera ascorbata]|uniref:citrate lyase holo-[acyl-carrier protein] synthase n=1 Tax=Kluyvera ascorbata TaxID=51288 RepID=UPI0020544CD3|nr:citrate lyase holo-[acyl-carrier protein] synthase [Kluyvera ascorbata]UPQ71033.1 citrate lyase holo-[acyl-carrier protein] synthase [Kluyvera ascorbata]
MNGADLLSSGQPVTLEAMLYARDSRAARQRQALDCYRLPLITFSLVAPGAVKNSPVWLRVAEYAQREIAAVCQQMEWVSVWEARTDALSGPEWMAAVCAPAKALKRQLMMLEQQHPLGRLWDIDVMDSDGRSLSRRELGLPARKCLICQSEAHVCARGRAHSLDLLLDEIARRIDSYERERSDGTAYAS